MKNTILKIEKKLRTENLETISSNCAEGSIRYVFENLNRNYDYSKTDDVYLFVSGFLDAFNYIFYCKEGFQTQINSSPSAISRILLMENGELHIRDMSQSPENPKPYFSVKAEYFSLYSIDNVNWETINILEIVKEIEKMEEKPLS